MIMLKNELRQLDWKRMKIILCKKRGLVPYFIYSGLVLKVEVK